MKPPTPGPAQAAPMTVGRRVAARRISLGFERDFVARRAGMSSSYLEYLEDQGGHPSAGVARRLAEALHTTVEHLYGEEGLDPELSLSRNRPIDPLSALAQAHSHVVTRLSAENCQLLMGSVPVGRVAFVVNGPPLVMPVNFTLMGKEIVIQTSATSRLCALAKAGGMISFEVDDFDEPYRLGWSVLCHGRASLSSETGADDHHAEHLALPWIGDLRHKVIVVITPMTVTGRRVGMA